MTQDKGLGTLVQIPALSFSSRMALRNLLIVNSISFLLWKYAPACLTGKICVLDIILYTKALYISNTRKTMQVINTNAMLLLHLCGLLESNHRPYVPDRIVNLIYSHCLWTEFHHLGYLILFIFCSHISGLSL